MYSAEDDRPAAAAAGPKKRPDTDITGNTVQSINQQSEKPTLGEIEALSTLKKKMGDD